MQTKQQTVNQPTNPGFQPIPTRIRDIAPLIVDAESGIDQETRSQVISSLEELGTNLASVHRTAAEAYLSQAMYEQAIPHLETAVRYQLGFVAYLAGNDELAIQSFQAVIGKDARQQDAIFNLGMVLFGKSIYEQAENCFRAYLELQPDDAQAWNNRGVTLHQIGRSDDARACFQRALQIDPNDQDAQFNLQSI